MTNEVLPRKSVVDLLEEQLRADIIAGHYAPGTLLPPERELAERYQVTRTSLRQSLTRLEQLGLVETRHGVGTRVLAFEDSAGTELLSVLLAEAGGAVIGDVFEARRLLGSVIAREAAVRAGAVDRAELRRALEALRRSPRYGPAHAAENDVHRLLATISGNSVFRLLVNTFLRAYEPVRAALDQAFAEPTTIASELEPLVAAVEAGDAVAAEQAAADYYETSARRLTRALGIES